MTRSGRPEQVPEHEWFARYLDEHHASGVRRRVAALAAALNRPADGGALLPVVRLGYALRGSRERVPRLARRLEAPAPSGPALDELAALLDAAVDELTGRPVPTVHRERIALDAPTQWVRDAGARVELRFLRARDADGVIALRPRDSWTAFLESLAARGLDDVECVNWPGLDIRSQDTTDLARAASAAFPHAGTGHISCRIHRPR
ncbi:hypothetical protein [Streptomyces coffeae]|uniref:Transcriptional regulator n=1 Tax=Streptomyces coffeae TaxID=621382 RepID=A0ABS1NL68_9ACTN|nr:hypothetical protein [Streptomyces coffeae]MBL1100801.1 hypothetical protein [Streptomyces coffeae]